MVHILKKEQTKLRVREAKLPIVVDKILGKGIDVMALPEGHLSCARCGTFKFECWTYGDNFRIEMGCLECGENYRMLLPLDVHFPHNGRFSCKKHPDKGMILIHNVDVVSIGCECCRTELDIKLKKAKGLVLASE